jgi:hypothetical protein
MFAQLVPITPAEVSRFTISQQQIMAVLTGDEAGEWRSAAARAEAEGNSLHRHRPSLRVGRKPVWQADEA